WCRQESQTPFDLQQGSLCRFHLLRLAEQLHVLFLTAHHTIIDGWSWSVILREISALYTAACQGTDCQLEPPMQFRAYVQWRQHQDQTEALAAHEAYWLAQFADTVPLMQLPTDHPRPPIKTYRGSRETLRLEAALGSEVKRVSRERGCTVFMTLLATYATLLHRLTGQDDLVVGIPTAGRSLPGSEELVGYCVHLLPIRSRLPVDATFSAYQRTIRSILLDAYEHQDYPFASLLNQLSAVRDLSRSPLITATFNLERSFTVPPMFGLE